MSDPWRGAATPLSDADLQRLARGHDVEPDKIRTIIAVEASGRWFRDDGTLPRRFEPHHLPPQQQAEIGWSGGWRASLALDGVPGRRAALFDAACRADLEKALRATSWGGPQIMGWHADSLGYGSAREMVVAFSHTAAEQVRAMLLLLDHMGALGALRACDWHAVARAWNGTGQAAVYAQRLESAWRRIVGAPSARVLRVGDRGQSVRELQAALGVPVDGAFGPGTLEAVKALQGAAGLRVDGIVGDRTWQALRTRRAPEQAPTPAPRPKAQRSLGDTAQDFGAAAMAGVGGASMVTKQADGMVEQVREWAGPQYGDQVVLGLLGVAAAVAVAFVVKRLFWRPKPAAAA